MKYILLIFLSFNCFAEFVIIHNKHDKVSREFVESYAGDYKIIDYYDYENKDNIKFRESGINIGQMPSVVDDELKIVIGIPSNLSVALAEIKDKDKYKINKVLKAMRFGQEIIATVRSRNIDNDVSIETRDTMEANMATIIKRLDAGQLVEAKTLIEAITPDGDLITQAFKDSILVKITNYLAEG